MINILKPKLNLNSTQKLILDSVKKFCKNELDISKKNNIRDLYLKFGENGILGPTIEKYGGLGLSYKMYGLIAKEIEYIDSGFRSMYSVQSSLVMNPINKYANEELKEEFLPKLNKGEFIGCFGLTEPDSGSDASNMKTTAKEDGDYYILNGAKTWITNSPLADVIIIWAKNIDTKKINGFILDRNMDGIQTPEIKDKMSLLSSTTGMIFLDNVKVPKINKLDIEGMKGPLSCLNDARLGIAFGVLGAAKSCLDITLDYTLNRKLFGSYLAEKQLIQNKLSNMVTNYNLGYLGVLHLADLKDENSEIPEMISMLKRNNCQVALDTARTCRDMLGGNGISKEYKIFNHLVNLETVNTYEGTSDIHSLIIGNYLTNYKAF